MSKEIVKQKRTDIKKTLNGMKGQIAQALPKHISPDVMISTALSTVISNQKLLDCTPTSIAQSVYFASRLGLLPNPSLGHCYIIPYGNQANFQLGYKGLLQLMRRTGNIASITAEAVYKQDVFDFDLANGIQKHLRSDDTSYLDNDITHFYCIIKYKQGGRDEKVMFRKEVEAHRDRFSQSYNRKAKGSVWDENFASMGKKTVILQTAKYAEVSTEVQYATAYDEGNPEAQKEFYAKMMDSEDPALASEAEDWQEAQVVEEKEQEVKAKREEVKQKGDKAVKGAMDDIVKNKRKQEQEGEEIEFK